MSISDGFGNVLRPPGTTEKLIYRPKEILASYARFTQKGRTLEGGQGFIPAGTVLARKSSNKKWTVYNNAGSGGAEVAKGILRDDVDTGSGTASRDMLCNVIMSGIVYYSSLSGLDSNAITDLNGRVDAEADWFVW